MKTQPFTSGDRDRPELHEQEGRGYLSVLAQHADALRAHLLAHGIVTGYPTPLAGRFVQLELGGSWRGERVHALLALWWRSASMTFEPPFALPPPEEAVVFVARVEGSRVRCLVPWLSLVARKVVPRRRFDPDLALQSVVDRLGEFHEEVRSRLALSTPTNDELRL